MSRDPLAPRHSPLPSRSVAVGTLGGGGVAPLAVWIMAEFFGVSVPPEIAATIGSILGGVFGYTVRGGRKS